MRGETRAIDQGGDTGAIDRTESRETDLRTCFSDSLHSPLRPAILFYQVPLHFSRKLSFICYIPIHCDSAGHPTPSHQASPPSTSWSLVGSLEDQDTFEKKQQKRPTPPPMLPPSSPTSAPPTHTHSHKLNCWYGTEEMALPPQCLRSPY